MYEHKGDVHMTIIWHAVRVAACFRLVVRVAAGLGLLLRVFLPPLFCCCCCCACLCPSFCCTWLLMFIYLVIVYHAYAPLWFAYRALASNALYTKTRLVPLIRVAGKQVQACLEKTESRGPRYPAILGVAAQELRAGRGDFRKVLHGHGRKERLALRR